MPRAVLDSASTVAMAYPTSCDGLTDVFFLHVLRAFVTYLLPLNLHPHYLSFPSLLLDSGKHPGPPASMFSELLNTTHKTPPPVLPVSPVLLAKASHQITCYVQSQQQSDAAICWGHTRWDPVE